MHIEVKKKLLATAISDIKGITDALFPKLKADESHALRLRTKKNTIKIASVYAEVTLRDVEVKEAGEAILSLTSFQQALAVSGDTFKVRLEEGDKSAFFWCGRSKGPIALKDDGFHDQVLQDAPKASIHVVGFKDLLSSIAMKAVGGGDSDRTLHFDPKEGSIRGESSDGFRGTVVVAKTTSDDKYPASALSLPQKPCDQLAKLVRESKIGFGDNFLSVVAPGIKVVMPLSVNPPLEIKAQLDDYLTSMTNYGTFEVKVSELKGALSDAMNMIGKDLNAKIDLELSSASEEARFVGESSAGEIESDFTVERTDLSSDVVMSLSAPYLREILDFYKQDVIRCTAYDSVIALDLATKGEQIKSQTTVVPLIASIQSDEEDKPKAKAKPKKKAKKPEPKDEDFDDEDEE